MSKEYLNFIEDESYEGKTKIFDVWNKLTDYYLGQIKWDCGWRQYVFIQRIDVEIKMSSSCERQLADFKDKLMEERK
jgi:hypothetical protein